MLSGAIVVAAYVALAAWSASISPLARLPLLDGLGPAQPYRWVNPPPDLAADNQPPSAGAFELELTADGVRGAVLITSDDQVTAIVPDGAIGAHDDDDAVTLRIDPVDPATLAPVPDDLEVQGNAYVISATYEPSGVEVPRFEQPIDVILLYPVTPDVHVATHEMLRERTNGWRRLRTTDSPAQQQAEALVSGPGHVVVAGTPGPVPNAPTDAGGGMNPVAVGLAVAAVCVALVGIGFLVRGRR